MGIPNRHPEKHFALCLDCSLPECNSRDPRCLVEAARESDRQERREEATDYGGWPSSSDVAKNLGFNRATVAKWCRNGEIKGAKKIRRNSITAWVVPPKEEERQKSLLISRELRKESVGRPSPRVGEHLR